MTPEEVAWVAGYFEGEGCISHSVLSRTTSLWITSTDLDVLEKFRNVVKVGTIYKDESPKKPHHKQCWRWGVHNWDHISPLLRAMLPHLGERRRTKALEVLQNPRKQGAPVKHVGCKVRGCSNPHSALGLCNQHYQKEYRRKVGRH